MGSAHIRIHTPSTELLPFSSQNLMAAGGTAPSRIRGRLAGCWKSRCHCHAEAFACYPERREGSFAFRSGQTARTIPAFVESGECRDPSSPSASGDDGLGDFSATCCCPPRRPHDFKGCGEGSFCGPWALPPPEKLPAETVSDAFDRFQVGQLPRTVNSKVDGDDGN